MAKIKKIKPVVFISVLVLIFLAIVFVKLRINETQANFTLVFIPDTQKLSSDEEFGDPKRPELLFSRMKAMATWIADHKDSLNILFVAHLGDMTEDHDGEIQWERNVDTWIILNEAGIPLIPCHGNHDSISALNEYFPVREYQANEFWGGSMNGGIENAYYLFEENQMKFILVLRQFGPDKEVDEWVNDVFSKYSERRGIFITHNGMSQMKGGTHHVENILKKHDNIFMAHMGHVTKNNGNEYWISNSSNGKDQHILRANYQNRIDSSLSATPMAILRYYTFKPNENKIFAYTYNVTTGSYYKDPDHQFSISDNMDLN